MLPDSTVADTKKAKKKRKSEKTEEKNGAPAKKNKKKPETSQKKLLVKKKTKKKVENEDCGSDMDLDKELHPIGYYIKDREELVRQMFACLKKTKVRSMLPSILKKYSSDEIERLCGEQLQIMSKKRILALVQGKNSDDISSSSTEDLSSDDDAMKVVGKVCLDPPDSTGVLCELPSAGDEVQMLEPHAVAGPKASGKEVNEQKLEILELELRARAIKKMLQRQHGEMECEGDGVSVSTEASIEADIRKHMAEQEVQQSAEIVQPSPSRVESDVGRASAHPQLKKSVRKRTHSEMEPGEISDYEEEEGDTLMAAKSAPVKETAIGEASQSEGRRETSQSEGRREIRQSEGRRETSQSEGVRETSQSERTRGSGKGPEEGAVEEGGESDGEVSADANEEIIGVSEKQRDPEAVDGNLEEGEVSGHEAAEGEQNRLDSKISSSNRFVSDKIGRDMLVDEGEDNPNLSNNVVSQNSPAPADDVEEVSSTLYETAQSSGKLSPMAQSLASPYRQASDSDDGRELMAPEPSVTSSDSKFKCTGLNWSADIDINIDQLDEDLCDSDREREPAEPDIKRVLTPEITAQRYQSRSFSSTLSLIACEVEERDDGEKTAKPNTKIHSSASTVGLKPNKSTKRDRSEAKRKLDSERKTDHRSKTTGESREKDRKKRVKSADNKRSDMREKDEIIEEKPAASERNRSERDEHDKRKKKSSSHSHHETKESERKIEHSRRRRYGESCDHTENSEKSRKLSPQRPNMFQRLSNHPMEPPSLSERFKNYQPRRSPSPRKEKDHTISASRYQEKHVKRRESGPTLGSDHDSRRCRRSSVDEMNRRASRLSCHHNVVTLPSNRASDTKRKCTSLSDKPSAVKTYDLVHTDAQKKIRNEQKSKSSNRKKSPVRFPSPEVTIVDKVKPSPWPMVVVISDSD